MTITYTTKKKTFQNFFCEKYKYYISYRVLKNLAASTTSLKRNISNFYTNTNETKKIHIYNDNHTKTASAYINTNLVQTDPQISAI